MVLDEALGHGKIDWDPFQSQLDPYLNSIIYQYPSIVFLWVTAARRLKVKKHKTGGWAVIRTVFTIYLMQEPQIGRNGQWAVSRAWAVTRKTTVYVKSSPIQYQLLNKQLFAMSKKGMIITKHHTNKSTEATRWQELRWSPIQVTRR